MKYGFFVSLILFTVMCRAQEAGGDSPTPAEMISWSEEQIEVAREELVQGREALAAEQRPLLERLMELQKEVNELRRERDDVSSSTQSIEYRIEELGKDISVYETTVNGARSRLFAIRSKFEDALHPIERPLYEDKLLASERIKAGEPDSLSNEIEAFFEVAEAGLERVSSGLGGRRFEGSVIVDGIVESGTVLPLGPYLFWGNESGRAGVIEEKGFDVHLGELPVMGSVGEIQKVLEGQVGVLPFDPTLGDAFLELNSKQSLWEHLRSGGLWVIPISLFGILSMILSILKVKQILSVKIPTIEEVDTLVSAKDETAFDAGLKELSPMVHIVFKEGFSYRKVSEKIRSAAMYQVFLTFRHRLESGVTLLALTAGVAPLLGLLGTVTGMIKTFEIIGIHGSGDARVLSGGISEALVTTEFGLVVAIPALLAHGWINRRVGRITTETAALADRFTKVIPSDDEDV